MEISPDDARQSLEEIQAVMARTRREMSHGTSGPIITVWGIIWILGYLATFFIFRAAPYRYPWMGQALMGWTWIILVPAGIFISWRIGRKSPFKSPFEKRIGILWGMVFLYAEIWNLIFWPNDFYQMGAFIATIPMFAYVVMGLWFDWKFMFRLGLIISGLIVLGYFLLHGNPWMWMWMAVFGGGGLTLSGMVICKGGRIHGGA